MRQNGILSFTRKTSPKVRRPLPTFLAMKIHLALKPNAMSGKILTVNKRTSWPKTFLLNNVVRSFEEILIWWAIKHLEQPVTYNVGFVMGVHWWLITPTFSYWRTSKTLFQKQSKIKALTKSNDHSRLSYHITNKKCILSWWNWFTGEKTTQECKNKKVQILFMTAYK